MTAKPDSTGFSQRLQSLGFSKPSQCIVDSLLESEEGIEIPDPDSISPEAWELISRKMKAKGYDIRGGEDAKELIKRQIGRRGRNLIRHDDWEQVFNQVLKLGRPEVQQKATAKENPRKVFRRAIKSWGLTYNTDMAGFILPNGGLLDLSGGSGVRAYDHREASAFLDHDYGERVDAMHAFMDLGIIRWGPEGPSFDIRKPPTPAQKAVMRQLISERPGKSFFVDVYSPAHGSEGAIYPPQIASHIPEFVDRFFKTGELKEPSQVQQFRENDEASGLDVEKYARLADPLREIKTGVKAVYDELKPRLKRRMRKVSYSPLHAHNRNGQVFGAIIITTTYLSDETFETVFNWINRAVKNHFSVYNHEDPRADYVKNKVTFVFVLNTPENSVIQRSKAYIYPERKKYTRRTATVENAEKIVRALLDDEHMDLPIEEPENSSGFSPAEMDRMLLQTGEFDKWEQIDGDYGDPWVYGATWHNPARDKPTSDKWASIIHIDGIEGSGVEDKDPDSEEVQTLISTDPEWQQKVEEMAAELREKYPRWSEEDIIEKAKGDVAYDAAQYLDTLAEQTVYRTNVQDDPADESWITDKLDAVLEHAGIDISEWNRIGKAGRLVVAADYYGWHEFDHYPIKLNKQELSKKLGFEL